MKNLIISFTIILSITLNAQSNYNRIIHWVHGLSGDHNSWAVPGVAVELGTNGMSQRNVLSNITIDYSEKSLDVATNHVYNQISLNNNNSILNQNANPNRLKHFIIAHSQGGIVSRSVAQYANNNNFTSQFGGIVTFGTPHGGAQILNNMDPNGPNMLNVFIIGACKELSKGIVAEQASAANLAKSLVFRLINFNDITDKTCDNVLTSNIINVFTEGFYAGITEDYKVNAQKITDMQNQTLPNINKVAFYGNETRGNELWRVGTSEINNQNQAQSSVAFSNNDDSHLIKTVNNAIYRNQAREELFQSIASGMGMLTVYIYYHAEHKNEVAYGWWLTRKEARKIRDGYRASKNWLIGANGQYKKIIGKKVVTFAQDGWDCECVELNTGLVTTTHFNNPPNDPPYCPHSQRTANGKKLCVLFPYFPPSVTHTASDGVVLTESAKAFPGIQPDHIVEMTNVNHQKLRNCNQTRLQLNELLLGNINQWYFTQ